MMNIEWIFSKGVQLRREYTKDAFEDFYHTLPISNENALKQIRDINKRMVKRIFFLKKVLLNLHSTASQERIKWLISSRPGIYHL